MNTANSRQLFPRQCGARVTPGSPQLY